MPQRLWNNVSLHRINVALSQDFFLRITNPQQRIIPCERFKDGFHFPKSDPKSAPKPALFLLCLLQGQTEHHDFLYFNVWNISTNHVKAKNYIIFHFHIWCFRIFQVTCVHVIYAACYLKSTFSIQNKYSMQFCFFCSKMQSAQCMSPWIQFFSCVVADNSRGAKQWVNYLLPWHNRKIAIHQLTPREFG